MAIAAQPSSGRLSMTPFMGIALADILANGVAIIMLLIVVTISSKHELEKEQLEQVDEVTRVLSREIASSVVMNNLTASAPAVLHDYNNSAFDQDLRHAVMPILELRGDHIREYYSGQVWPRAQLLRQDNALDAYLAQLNPTQQQRIRTDIYEIGMFYIYMSILKDHKLQARHWHFLIAEPGGAGGDQGGAGGGQDWSEFFTDDSTQGEGHGLDGRGQFGRGWGGELLGGDLGDGDYPWDAQGGEGEGDPNGQGTGQGGIASKFRFRVASPDGNLSAPTIGDALGDHNLKSLLTAVLSYLKYVDLLMQEGSVENAIENLPSYLQGFLRSPLALTPNEQTAIDGIVENVIRTQLIQQAIGTLSIPPPLSIDRALQPDTRGLAAAIPINQEINRIKIIGDARQRAYLDALPQSSDAYFHLQQYPDLFRGLSLELLPRSILLVADHAPSARWRWFPVFFIYPEFDDFVMGFLYGKMAQPGQLVVAAESNRITIAGYSLQSQRDHTPGENEYLLAAIFGIAILLALLFYALLLWRRSATAPTT